MMGVVCGAGIDNGRKSATRGLRADEGVRPTGDLACTR
jgi:hypothetical protein